MAETPEELRARIIAEHSMKSSRLIAKVSPIHEGMIGKRNKHILDTLLPGEPIIIFRAKDILSTMVLQHYSTLLETYSPYSEIADDVVGKINDFREWQHTNPASVKLPD